MARKRQLNPRAAGDYDKRLGELVRLRRKELGMSQSDLGAALGVSFQQIQKQERGVNRISAATLQKIAIALKAPLSFFQPSDEAGQAEVNTLLFKNAGLSLRLLRAYRSLPDAVGRHFVSAMEATAEALASQ
jgi:transcriptional regulator with XRE-family HTH domain